MADGREGMSEAFQNQRDVVNRAQDQHQKEREVLFENESLVVKVLQAVSGAALIGSLAQTKTLIALVGKISFFSLLTAMALALIAAVVAAYWKHQYKLWDVKAAAAQSKDEGEKRLKWSKLYLNGMRWAIWFSLMSIAAGLIQLLVCLWTVGLSK